MQATKDTFYLTLRDRLAQAYPTRTILFNGSTRTAMIVLENDQPSVAARQNDTFYVEWGEVRAVQPSTSKLMAMECRVSYGSAGTDAIGGLDRGRVVAEMDSELLAICSPCLTEKFDYTGASPVDLGSTIFWSVPTFQPSKAAPNCLAHEATITVYFFPEVNQA